MARKYDRYGYNRQFKTNPASRSDPFPRDSLPFQDAQSNGARAAKVAGKPIPKRNIGSYSRSAPKVQGHTRADIERAWQARRSATRAMRQAHPYGGLSGNYKVNPNYVTKVFAGTAGVIAAPIAAYEMASNVSAWASYFAANPEAQGVAEWNRFGLPAWKRALSRPNVRKAIAKGFVAYNGAMELHDLATRPSGKKFFRFAQRHL